MGINARIPTTFKGHKFQHGLLLRPIYDMQLERQIKIQHPANNFFKMFLFLSMIPSLWERFFLKPMTNQSYGINQSADLLAKLFSTCNSCLQLKYENLKLMAAWLILFLSRLVPVVRMRTQELSCRSQSLAWSTAHAPHPAQWGNVKLGNSEMRSL